MLCALPACATRTVESEPALRRAEEAEVRVLNRTSSDLQVEASGRPLGGVPAGGEQLFVGLSPGTVDLRGTSPDGVLLFRRDLLTLEPGETFTWILREEDRARAGERPGAEARRTATIVVENATAWDVEVLLDGQILGTTSAGATGRFGGILPGAHRLEARARETSFPREFPVLEPDEVFTWRLSAPGPAPARGILPARGTGRLRVENPHPEAITVLVNGAPLGSVEARNVRIFEDLAAGRVELTGESADGLTRYAGPTVRIDPGGVTVWRVGAGLANERVQPARPSPPPGPLPPGQPVPPPAEAAGEEPPAGVPGAGEPPAAPRGVPAAPGEAPEGRGEPAEAVVGKAFIVENRTSQDLEIFFDGKSAGAVGAGMTERFTDLPGPRFTPSAVTASGNREFRHPQVDLTSRDTFSWIIEP